MQAPNFEALRDFLPRFVEEAKKTNAFTVVEPNLKFNKPELKISIDRQKARALVFLQLILHKQFNLHSADRDLDIL